MENITLPIRQRKLLRILNEQRGIITGIELGRKMEVSDRTIRNDILDLNKILKNINVHIKSIRGKGYILNATDNSILQKLIYTEDSLLTQEDRVRYLVIRIIQSKNPVKLDELEDEIFVSRTTLEKDMRVIDKKYSKKGPYLKLIRRENIIFFEDNEEKKREVLKELFCKEWDYNFQNGMNFRDSIFDAKIFDIISLNVEGCIKKYKLKLNDEGLVYFVFTIAISCLRIKGGYSLSCERETKNNDLYITLAINELADCLQEVLNISFNHFERDYFAFILMKKRVSNLKDINRENIKEFINVEYIKIVELLINDIKKEYLLDFTKDDELFIELVIHVSTLVSKLRDEFVTESIVLDTLKNRYPLSFEMSLIFYKHFKKMFDVEIEENELSYIAAYLGVAIRRLINNVLDGEIIVAVVSHLNYSIFRLLETELKSTYGRKIKIVGPFSVYEKDEIANSGAEIVLSTVKIKDINLTGKRIITVSPFLLGEDLILINEYIDAINANVALPKLPLNIREYFDKRLFYYGLDIRSKDEAIKFLTQDLLKREYVGKEFLNSVLEREKISSTAFKSGIAMPHPMTNCCYKTIISVAILKKPIMWEGQKVKCIFLLSIKEDEKKYLIHFFNLVVDTLGNRANVNKILEASTFEKFISTIN